MTSDVDPATARFEIDPRAPELGGGWRPRLFEDGEEVGGGVFPASETEESKTDAYADAIEEAEGWLASRQAVPSP
jgi:hypothetical protein